MIHGTMKSSTTIERVRELLDNGRAREALALVNQHEDASDVWQNVRGACLLRLGDYERAVQVLRPIVFPGNAICVPEGIPALYQANFATAMLALHRTDGAMAIVEHLGHDGHPYVEQIHQAMRRWKESLTILQKVGLALGWYPKKPVQVDFPLGGL